MNDFMNLFFVFSFITLIITIVIIKAVKENSINIEGTHILVSFICMTISLFYLPSIMGYENTKIGSIYEGNEYVECYYVEVSSRGSQYKDRYIQKLPAQIYKDDNSYYMKYLYYLDGTVVPFTKSDETINVEYSTEVYDNSQKTYNITLTKEKADRPPLWETSVTSKNTNALEKFIGFLYGAFHIFVYINLIIVSIKMYI